MKIYTTQCLDSVLEHAQLANAIDQDNALEVEIEGYTQAALR